MAKGFFEDIFGAVKDFKDSASKSVKGAAEKIKTAGKTPLWEKTGNDLRGGSLNDRPGDEELDHHVNTYKAEVKNMKKGLRSDHNFRQAEMASSLILGQNVEGEDVLRAGKDAFFTLAKHLIAAKTAGLSKAYTLLSQVASPAGLLPLRLADSVGEKTAGKLTSQVSRGRSRSPSVSRGPGAGPRQSRRSM